MEILLLISGVLLLVLLLKRLRKVLAFTRKKKAARIEAEKEKARIMEIKTKLTTIVDAQRQKIGQAFGEYNTYVRDNLHEILPDESIKKLKSLDEKLATLEASTKEMYPLIDEKNEMEGVLASLKQFPFGSGTHKVYKKFAEAEKSILNMETAISKLIVIYTRIGEMKNILPEVKNKEDFRNIVSAIGDASLEYKTEMERQYATHGDIVYDVFHKSQNDAASLLIEVLDIPEFNERYAALMTQ